MIYIDQYISTYVRHPRVLITQYESKLKTSLRRIKLKRYHMIIINCLTVYTGTDSLPLLSSLRLNIEVN